jgi:hypothetical protein
MKLVKGLTAGVAIVMLSACASKQETTAPAAATSTKLPSWVLNPIIENGIADTQCVQTTADFNVLKNKATALARAELTKQIEVNVKAMDKTYQRLTDTAQGSSTGSDFESVSRQLASQTLSGSRTTQVDYVDFPDGTQKLCVLVTLSPELTETLFKNIVKQSGRNISPKDEAVLYERFLAKKAGEEMDKEFDNYRNQ